MKYCNGCCRDLDELMYSTDRSRSDDLQSRCKDCCNAYRKKHYTKNKAKAISYVIARVIANKKRLYGYLMDHPCVQCGESDPIVLEFDHINPDEKEASIHWAITKWKWERVLAEIAKCQVLCANCHKRRIAKQQKWYSFMDKV
jgi:hypothetical protein